jgi:hypothetical protein
MNQRALERKIELDPIISDFFSLCDAKSVLNWTLAHRNRGRLPSDSFVERRNAVITCAFFDESVPPIEPANAQGLWSSRKWAWGQRVEA